MTLGQAQLQLCRLQEVPLSVPQLSYRCDLDDTFQGYLILLLKRLARVAVVCLLRAPLCTCMQLQARDKLSLRAAAVGSAQTV